MNGAKAIKAKTKINKGSVTVETAIILPIFMVAIFSFAYIIRIFYIYNTMQDSLAEVSRQIGNMSYFYHVTGLKDYSDALNEAANEAQGTLSSQCDVLLNVVNSFNDTVTGVSSQSISIDTIENLISGANDIGSNFSEAVELVQTIISDPKAELQLLLTVFAQKLNYEINNKVVCLIAKGCLGRELDKRAGPGKEDAAIKLGVKGGIKGIDFKGSSVFGDSESLEFVINYSVKAPLIFSILPEIKLSNRVKYIAWTGGRGESVLEQEAEAIDEDASLWTKNDNSKRYWDRGNVIEKLEVDKILKSAGRGVQASGTSSKYPVIDAYTYNSANGLVEYYDIFTLNPFMKTYTKTPSAIKSEIKKHGKRLKEFDPQDILQNVEIKEVRRIIIFVIPDNSQAYAIEEFNKAKAELEKLKVEVRLVTGYGSYEPIKEETLDEAA